MHTHDEDVAVVKEKVPLVDWNVNLEQVSDPLSSFLRLELFLNDFDRILDGISTGWARLIGAHEDVQIEGLEVLDRMDET